MAGAAPETSTSTTPRTSMAKSCALELRAATVMEPTALAEEVGLMIPVDHSQLVLSQPPWSSRRMASVRRALSCIHKRVLRAPLPDCARLRIACANSRKQSQGEFG